VVVIEDTSETLAKVWLKNECALQTAVRGSIEGSIMLLFLLTCT